MTTTLFIVLIIAAAAITWLFAKTTYASVEKQKAVAEHALQELRLQYDELQEQFDINNKELNRLTAELAHARAVNDGLEEKLLEQKQTLSREFELLANKILEDKSQRFTEQNKNNLDILLNPLKEKIKAFEEKVDLAYKAEAAERNSLRGEIKNLVEMNKKISDDANHLAAALKGDTKQQGDWGELVLEKILESSGLEKDREYKLQLTTENAEGERIRPDAVIYLPDDKHLIIDSKVSLKAYSDFSNETDETTRNQALLMHISSVRNHIKNLGDKYYQTARGLQTPDFILMFLPIESSFSAAVKADNELFNYAWDRRIVIVSPTTLLATLRTIASIWKQERQTRNALQIAEEGGRMYDKLVAFMEDLVKVGKKIDDSKTEYVTAMNKLFDGSGNLIRRAEKMKELGAKVTKSLPSQLIDRAE